MTTVAMFSLAALIRAELDASSSPDPGDIATAVVSQIPDEYLREALTEVLRDSVRRMIHDHRRSNPPAQSAPPAANRSAKVTGIRVGWRLHLRERYHVGGSTWRFLADMTHDDLLAAAAERQELAVRNVTQAERLFSWAELVAKHRVSTFGQLPEAVLQAALA